MKRKTTEQFIIEARKIHGDKYDYSLVEYIGAHHKINIICKQHDKFKQTPHHHLNSHGCKKCNYINQSNKQKMDLNNFITRSNIIHNNKYDYSLVEYKNNCTKVKIICPIHGVFNQIPQDHLKGCGCSECCVNKRLTTKIFIDKSKEIHNNKYDYSLVNYINNRIKVKIICPVHGIFEQIPNSHLLGNGCIYCNDSKGEKQIKAILNKLNITYESQKKFDNCKYIKKLYFDFYLPNYNTCIEYDGLQHFKIIKQFGGEKEFINIQNRDKIKNEYCKNNNIHLLRIKYNENINKKLLEYLKF